MTERTRTWARRIIGALAIIVPGGAAFMFVSIQVSSQPRFCGTCHNMRPYYESWKTSSHNKIACVECHIPPGISSEIRKKYEALSMVARYFTGTYSTNPWTEVDDQSCLRSGCHTKRVLLGREVYKGVLFDHQPHLTEMRRGKELRCTSCHSQIVQGSHIAVTATTCFLCHFKNVPPNTGTARCTLCHQIPDKVVTTGGLSFNHGDVKRFDMQCMSCHEGIIKGEGEVPRERCFTCHNDTARLSRWGEGEFLHRTHVTEHKVECLNCHIQISHHIPAREEALASECRSCHSAAAGHSAVRDLYRGIGARGVTPQPAKMYLAGIRCEACHNRPRGDEQVANEVSCMACHGPKYAVIYRNWQHGLTERLDGVRAELQGAVARLTVSKNAADPLATAKDNLALLERGHAIHNPGYAVDILRKVHDDVSQALTAAGDPAPALPWKEAPYASECLRCHFGIESLTTKAFGKDFPHQKHVLSARLRCTICHGDQSQHGTLRLQAEDCTTCHARIDRPMTDVAADACLTCHTAALGRTGDAVKFPHEKHVEAGLDCRVCHQGVDDLPHRKFAHSPQALPKREHALCGTCHGGDVPGEDGTPPDDANCAMCHGG